MKYAQLILERTAPKCNSVFVSFESRRFLELQLETRASRNDVDPLLAQLSWAHIDAFEILDRIPVDGRHNAKIDYPALLRVLAHPE